MLLEDVEIQCPCCGELQWIEIDPSEGKAQRFILDCQVCCKSLDISANKEENIEFQILVTSSY